MNEVVVGLVAWLGFSESLMKQGLAMLVLNLTTASQEAVIEELGTADKPNVYGHKPVFEGVRFGITLPQILSILNT